MHAEQNHLPSCFRLTLPHPILVLPPSLSPPHQGGALRYNTVPANGWAWWAYNENSGDTGGIVKNFWQDLHWEKINLMIARYGLRPWYLRTGRRPRRTP
jgi:hypothetical protein